jgi:hypothetical protein
MAYVYRYAARPFVAAGDFRGGRSPALAGVG